MNEKNHKKYKDIGRGFCMGVADMVPGVSGATIALLLGIYPRLMKALSHVDAHALKLLLAGEVRAMWRYVDGSFLIRLLSGIVLAVALALWGIDLPGLLHAYPQYVYGVFFLLVTGASLHLLRCYMRWELKALAVLLVGVLAGVGLSAGAPQLVPHHMVGHGLAGFMAICAMLLPGVSGSLLLVMIGHYTVIVSALKIMDMSVVGPFIGGAILAALLMPRLLTHLLARYPVVMHRLGTGLVVSSLWVLWPL